MTAYRVCWRSLVYQLMYLWMPSSCAFLSRLFTLFSEHILCLGAPNSTPVLFSCGDWAVLTKRPRCRQMQPHQPSNHQLLWSILCLHPVVQKLAINFRTWPCSRCGVTSNCMSGDVLANLLWLFNRRFCWRESPVWIVLYLMCLIFVLCFNIPTTKGLHNP